MKKTLLFLLFFPFAALSQIPQWQWAKTHTLNSNAGKSMIATDNQGNVYVAGEFAATTMTIGNFTLTNQDQIFGLWDMYVVKYDPSGNLLWARSYGSSDNESPSSITTDNSGNFYIIGNYQNTTSLGGIILEGTQSNSFVAKFDSEGNGIWAKTNDNASPGWDSGGLAVDTSGNVYFSGVYNAPSLSFDGNEITYQNHVANGNNAGIPFVVKLNQDGETVWARTSNRTTANSGGAFANGVCVDSQSNVFVSGGFMVPVLQFGNITLTKINPSMWNVTMFLAKYDANGNIMWAKQAGTQFENTTMASDVAVDAQDNLFVAGTFCNTVNWDNVSLSAGGGAGSFLVKYDANGVAQWGKTSFGSNVTAFRSLRVDATGNVYVAGNTGSTNENFGNNVILNTPSPGAAFIVKYNNQGNAVWVQKAGPVSNINSSSMALVNENDFYLAGTFTENQISFGSIPLARNTQTAYNRFLARMLYVPLDVDDENKSSFTLYPNPTKGEVFVHGLGQSTSFEIVDASGRVIKTGKSGVDGTSIDLSALPTGIYYLKVQGLEKESAVRKIVKM